MKTTFSLRDHHEREQQAIIFRKLRDECTMKFGLIGFRSIIITLTLVNDHCQTLDGGIRLAT